jgi:transposase
MPGVEDVPVAALRRELDRIEDAKAVRRLMVAIAYRDGVDVETLSDRYGIPVSTIYAWLDRFGNRTVTDAVTDDTSPGRPAKLSPEQRRTVRTWLRDSPREAGLDGDEWTPELLRDHIRTAFDVEYSLGHVRRILREER